MTDSLGCKNFTTVAVKVNLLPQGKLVSDNTGNYCVPFCSEFRMIKTTANPIISTSWVLNDNTVSTESFSHCMRAEGVDRVKGIFTDQVGCSNTLTFAITGRQVPVAGFTFSPITPVETLDEVLFTNLSTGTKLSSYRWFFIENGNYISPDRNTAMHFDDAGEYNVALVVENEWGCKDTAVKAVIIESDVKLYVPEAFSPNHDGINEVFQAKGRGIKDYSFDIYDRWGLLLFHSDKFDEGWAGTLKGENCANDIYTWKIVATDIKGKSHQLAGRVTLMR